MSSDQISQTHSADRGAALERAMRHGVRGALETSNWRSVTRHGSWSSIATPVSTVRSGMPRRSSAPAHEIAVQEHSPRGLTGPNATHSSADGGVSSPQLSAESSPGVGVSPAEQQQCSIFGASIASPPSGVAGTPQQRSPAAAQIQRHEPLPKPSDHVSIAITASQFAARWTVRGNTLTFILQQESVGARPTRFQIWESRFLGPTGAKQRPSRLVTGLIICPA